MQKYSSLFVRGYLIKSCIRHKSREAYYMTMNMHIDGEHEPYYCSDKDTQERLIGELAITKPERHQMTLWRKWQVSKQNNMAEWNNDITFFTPKHFAKSSCLKDSSRPPAVFV